MKLAVYITTNSDRSFYTLNIALFLENLFCLLLNFQFYVTFSHTNFTSLSFNGLHCIKVSINVSKFPTSEELRFIYLYYLIIYINYNLVKFFLNIKTKISLFYCISIKLFYCLSRIIIKFVYSGYFSLFIFIVYVSWLYKYGNKNNNL
jgi:hypothetical protein